MMKDVCILGSKDAEVDVSTVLDGKNYEECSSKIYFCQKFINIRLLKRIIEAQWKKT